MPLALGESQLLRARKGPLLLSIARLRDDDEVQDGRRKAVKALLRDLVGVVAGERKRYQPRKAPDVYEEELAAAKEARQQRYRLGKQGADLPLSFCGVERPKAAKQSRRNAAEEPSTCFDEYSDLQLLCKQAESAAKLDLTGRDGRTRLVALAVLLMANLGFDVDETGDKPNIKRLSCADLDVQVRDADGGEEDGVQGAVLGVRIFDGDEADETRELPLSPEMKRAVQQLLASRRPAGIAEAAKATPADLLFGDLLTTDLIRYTTSASVGSKPTKAAADARKSSGREVEDTSEDWLMADEAAAFLAEEDLYKQWRRSFREAETEAHHQEAPSLPRQEQEVPPVEDPKPNQEPATSRQRSKSKRKKGTKRKRGKTPAHYEDSPIPGVHGKYWAQRWRLFSRFDSGIQLDKEGWYSTSPERLASHVAERIARTGNDLCVVDAFCGCGGNAVQLAMQEAISSVIAIDIDEEHLRMVKHNSAIYGVSEKIRVVQGDAWQMLRSKAWSSIGEAPDAVLLSPPWGGPNYLDRDTFSISLGIQNSYSGRGEDGCDLFRKAVATGAKNIVYLLPRNTPESEISDLLETIPGLAGTHHSGDKPLIELEDQCLNGKLKMRAAYFGQVLGLPPSGSALEMDLVAPGDTVEVFYEAEEDWFPACVNSVKHSLGSTVFSVTYIGYDEDDTVECQVEDLARRIRMIERA